MAGTGRELLGLSPRGRGNPARPVPPWYGQKVYPRVGGGTFSGFEFVVADFGLSPRGRGNRFQEGDEYEADRSIPAWAGEPESSQSPRSHSRVYPRVGGGTHMETAGIEHTEGLSPRGRGNLPLERQRLGPLGSIPAWAGEPAAPQAGQALLSVYPRVGGGTAFIRSWIAPLSGLSPRGRGNPSALTPTAAGSRSIPAWAGEPQQDARRDLLRVVYPRVGGGTQPRGEVPPP